MPGSNVVVKDGKYILVDKEKNEKNSLIEKLCKEGKVNEKFCK